MSTFRFWIEVALYLVDCDLRLAERRRYWTWMKCGLCYTVCWCCWMEICMPYCGVEESELDCGMNTRCTNDEYAITIGMHLMFYWVCVSWPISMGLDLDVKKGNSGAEEWRNQIDCNIICSIIYAFIISIEVMRINIYVSFVIIM